MADPKLESPDGLELRAKPTISARLNKKAVIIIGAIFIGIGLVIMANVSKDPQAVQKTAQSSLVEANLQPASASATALTSDVPDQQLILPEEPIKLPPPKAGPSDDGASPKALPAPSGTESVPDISGGGAGAGEFSKSALQAMQADTTPARFVEAAAQGAAPSSVTLPPATPVAGSSGADRASQEPDFNGQGDKRAFLERAAQPKQAPVEIVQLNQPISDFEIKTGSVISSVLVSYVNSDLPGDIVGQVAENVFDSTTGRHLLIPQGTKLYGRYDSSVNFGQKRLLVVWNRLIFPNGSTMDLNGMAGHDKEGTSGFHDLVNNHYLKIFGFGLLTSVFSAAFQVSQPQQATGVTNQALSTQQTMAAAVGQQMTQLGVEIARRNMQVQPTLEIRKGYKFHVMVNKDLVFASSYRP